MRIVVTGSDGFVGRHAVARLHEQGHEVIELDRKTGADLSPLNEQTQHLISATKPDYIVHLASSVSTPGSIDSPVETFRDTVMTAVNVLEAARQSKSPVLITSSVKARDGWTPYGAAKQMVEVWAIEYLNAYDIPILINRPGTIYGPGQEGSTESGWVAWFLKAKKEGMTVTINGDGSQVRDLLHVDDYVELLTMEISDHVLGKIDWAGQTYDIGGGERNAMSVLGMAHFLGLKYELGPPRYGDSERYVGRNTYPAWSPTIHWRSSDVFSGPS